MVMVGMLIMVAMGQGHKGGDASAGKDGGQTPQPARLAGFSEQMGGPHLQ